MRNDRERRYMWGWRRGATSATGRAGAAAIAVLLAGGAWSPALADETFIYQGKLLDAGSPASGDFNFEFRLCLFEVAGPVLQTFQGVYSATDGQVVAEIAFTDNTFNGAAYWLEIGVKPDGSPDPYETLTPRQPLHPVPYAQFAMNNSSGWTSDGFNTLFDGFGVVAIGTGTPSMTAKLEILSPFNNGILLSQTLNSPNPVTGFQAFTVNNGTGSTVAIEGITNGSGIGVKGVSNFAGGTAVYGLTTDGRAISGQSLGANGFASYFQGGKNYFEGPVGLGTTTPQTPIHVEGGTANGLNPGDGFAMFGASNGVNLIADSAGLQRRNNGAAAPLFLNRQGGDIIVGDANAPVNIGNGTIFPSARIDVRSEDATDLMRLASGPNANDMILKVTPDGFVGVNTNAPTVPLHITGFAAFDDQVGIGTTASNATLEILSDRYRAVHVEHTFADVTGRPAMFILADNPGTGTARAIEAITQGANDQTILAEADGNSATAIYAHADSTGGTGIHGHANFSNGVNYGIRGSTNSPDGYAAYFTGGRNYFEGNVGIGNTTPNFPFEVRASSTSLGALIENTSVGDAALQCVGPFSGIGVIGVGEGDGGAAVVGTAFDGAVAGLFEGEVDVEGRLDVSRSVSTPLTWSGHVARIENTSTSDDGDLLALKSHTTGGQPSNNVNFITFFNDSEQSLGAIEGDFFGGVQFVGPGGDYAEWLPKIDPNEELLPGDVVGVVDGGISKRTDQAQQVMVITTQPIVVGNRPIEGEGGGLDGWAKVAFIGQAPVKVRGPVRTGDFIVPSGRHDGVAVAITPGSITPVQLNQVVGTAWEFSDSEGVELITCAIGIGELPAAAHAMESMRSTIRVQQESIDDLMQRVRTLERIIGNPDP